MSYSRPAPKLEDLYSQLARLPHLGVEPGDIFRVPSRHLNFRSTRPNRFAVIVALVTESGAKHPSSAHMIVGSTKPDFISDVPSVRIEAGEGDMAEPTYFACDEASTVLLEVLRDRSECRYVGRLSETRLEELIIAVRLGQTRGYITPWIV